MCFEYTPLPTIEYTPLPTNERRLTAKPTSSCTTPKRQPTIGVSIFRVANAGRLDLANGGESHSSLPLIAPQLLVEEQRFGSLGSGGNISAVRV